MKMLLYFLLLIPLIVFCGEKENDFDKIRNNQVAIVVNQHLSQEITDSLNLYFEDLKNEGYEPILKKWSLEEQPSPKDLKQYLKSLYENGNLQGAVFIGDLPIAMFEDRSMKYLNAPFPTDSYFMDLENNEWQDGSTNDNNRIDNLVFIKGNRRRAIWVSRLKVSAISDQNKIDQGQEEIKLIKNYFKKNHEFRTGTRLYRERNWNFIALINSLYSNKNYNSYASLNEVTDFFFGYLSKDTFLKLLTEGSNEIALWSFHGFKNYISPIIDSDKVVFSDELKFLNIEIAFLLPISCWIGDYSADNYFAGSLLFSETSGVQALIAATIPIKSWSRDLFEYPFQEGHSFGESYLKYLSSEDFWYDEDLPDDERARVILGDGTLKRQRFLVGKDNISKDNTLRSFELRKEIAPSYILPLINTLRFDFLENKILWDRYYNEDDDLIYRLEKIKRDGSKILVYEGKDNQATDSDIAEPENYYILTYIWSDTESKPSNPILAQNGDPAIEYATKIKDFGLKKYLLHSRNESELESTLKSSQYPQPPHPSTDSLIHKAPVAPPKISAP